MNNNLKNNRGRWSWLGVLIFSLFPWLQSCGGKGACTPQIPGDRRITMSYLGQFGRFGNHVYEYIFLKNYAHRHHLKVETPAWIGDQLFGLNDPRISAHFCEIKESEALIRSYHPESSEVFVNRDFKGDFQIHTSHHDLGPGDRSYIQKILQPAPAMRELLDPWVKQLRANSSTLVAIHLRRGDFGKPPYVISPSEWYLKWLKQNWAHWKNPVLYLASDDVNQVIKDFESYNPKSFRDFRMEFPVPGADFYPDYYLLTQADVLAISNSTFSTSAALLNSVGTEFFRPDFDRKELVEFDPWSTTPFEGWHH